MISIIIPVYNEEKTIFRVLESVKEAFRDVEYEIVVVDDGSKDNTPVICVAYKNIQYIRLLCGQDLRAPKVHLSQSKMPTWNIIRQYCENFTIRRKRTSSYMASAAENRVIY